MPAGPVSDVYGLGCLLREALVGAVPHDGRDDAAVIAAAKQARRGRLTELVGVHELLATTVEDLLRGRVPDTATTAARLEAARVEASAGPPPPPVEAEATVTPSAAAPWPPPRTGPGSEPGTAPGPGGWRARCKICRETWSRRRDSNP